MAIKFENTRFDPDLTPFHGLAQQMAAAVGYTAELSLDAQLLQLLRRRPLMAAMAAMAANPIAII